MFKPGQGWLDSIHKKMPFGLERAEDVPPPAIKGFDWDLVRVGHWVVAGPPVRGKGGRAVWMCGSACGVRSPFRTDELARGATKSCEACRPGGTPPSPTRVATGQVLKDLQEMFRTGGLYLDKRSNLRGPEAIRDWDERAEPKLLALIDATGLGRDFGWKVFVRDCHARRGDPVVRVRGWGDSTRRCELSISGTEHLFEVDLSCGRTDKTWSEIRRAIENGMAPPKVVAAAVPPDEERLRKLQRGIEKAIEVRRDATAGAELRAEIQARLDAAKKELAPLQDKHIRTADAAAELLTKVKAAKDLADERQNQLRVAVERRDQLADLLRETAAERDAVAAKVQPVLDRVESIAKELAVADAMEVERAKTLAKAGDLSVLLKALEQLGV